MAVAPNLFIVDCGSDISIVKANKIKSSQIYYPSEKCEIIGIGHGNISTIGTTYANILLNGLQIPHKFHIVEDNFPIPTDGILGRDFLVNYKCKIDYDSWLLKVTTNFETLEIPIVNNFETPIILPARAETIKRINNININEDSVILSQEISPGIFCANSIVNKENCFVKFINTTENDFKLPMGFKPKHDSLTKYHYNMTSGTTCDEGRKQALIHEINTQNLEPQIKEKIEALCLLYLKKRGIS